MHAVIIVLLQLLLFSLSKRMLVAVVVIGANIVVGVVFILGPLSYSGI
jgi:hypothetical protein